MVNNLILGFDGLIRVLFPPQQRSAARVNPAQELPDTVLSMHERRHVAGLMRVNHAGEVCAQALYLGQAVTARQGAIQNQMTTAAKEEVDHLAWCEQRLSELSAETSLFNICWYSGSFMLGLLAGIAGDQWSLGFVAETERQVSAHLEKHIRKLPSTDSKTKAILVQMVIDETKHATQAEQAGGRRLPWLIRGAMQWVSKIMTMTSYYL